jgi:hypothetical protein
MRRLILAFVAIAAAFVATPARAANNFSIDWHEYNHAESCLSPGLTVEGQANFDVNTVPIPTYSDWDSYQQYAGTVFEMWFHAPFSGTLFRVGTNDIGFAVGANESDACIYVDDTVYLRGPGVDRLLFQASHQGSAIEGTTEVSLTLREIDPNLADSLAALKAAIDEARADLRAAGLDADELADGLERLDELEELLDELLERGWDDLTIEELNALLAAYDDLMPGVRDALVEFLADLQADIEQLRQEIERIAEVFAQQVDQVDGVLSGSPGWDPTDPDGFEPIEEGEFPPIDVPDVLGDDPWSEDHDPYADYADETIAAFETTVNNGVVADRTTFVGIYGAWRHNIATLELILQMRSTVSVAEWGAFLQAKQRVLVYLRQFMDEKGWLVDAPIPPAIKALVELLKDIDVAFKFKKRGEALQLELNTWHGELTGRQNAILEVLLLLDKLARERLAQPAPEEEEDGFWDIAGDIIDTAISFTPIGDFLDACRAITGQEDCIGGRDLSLEERALYGLGVVVGSGAAWKAAAGAVSGPAMGALRKVGDVLDEIPPRRPHVDNPNISIKTNHTGGAVTYRHVNGWEVRYNRRGFPDFSPHLYPAPAGRKSTVKITYTGSRKADFDEAWSKGKFTQTEIDTLSVDWVWHHHEDMGTMQLIRRDVHKAFAHNGGVAVWQRVYGQEYRP